MRVEKEFNYNFNLENQALRETMKLKKEYLILLLVIVALCAYLATRTKDQTHFKLPEIGEVDSQKINRLELIKGDSTIELNKKDDQWTVGPKNYRADDIKIKNMVKAVADFGVTALVSESGNYDRYDLSEDKKVQVRAYTDKQMLRDFDIGRQAPTNRHTFVKIADDPKVYHARGSIQATFDMTVEKLRDMAVLDYEKDGITSVTLLKDKQTVSMNKKEVAVPDTDKPVDEKETPSENKKEEQSKTKIQWLDSKGSEVLASDADQLIGNFSKLKCDKYLDDNVKAGLKDPVWTVTLMSDKGEYALSVYNRENEESNEYPATSSASPYAFVLNKSRIDTFEKQMDKLLKTEKESEKPKKPGKNKKTKK